MLAAYYDVPSRSLRFAVWPLIMANAPGFRVELGKYCLNEHRGNKDNFCRKMRRKLAEQGVSLASINGDAQLYAGEGPRRGTRGGGACLWQNLLLWSPRTHLVCTADIHLQTARTPPTVLAIAT